jgi:hypothetical protein
MQGVFLAAIAEFIELKPVGIVPAVLLAGVVALLALGALEVNHHAYIFLSHFSTLAVMSGGGMTRPVANR